MKLSELISRYTWQEVEPVYLELYPKEKRKRKRAREAFEFIQSLKPVGYEMRIHLECRDDEEGGYHDVSGRDGSLRLAYPVCCQSYYRVSPLAAVECLVGRCRGMCRESQDRVECRHWIETPVEAEHKFVEVSL